ncbi:MAG: insulinase family protein [Rhodospirillales bacterium]
MRPAFPTQAFSVVRRQVAQGLAGLLQSPGYLFRRATARAVAPPGDPSLREATPQTVMALQPADLQSFYKAAYRPDLTTIVVAGDVTPERARARGGRYVWQLAGRRGRRRRSICRRSGLAMAPRRGCPIRRRCRTA